MNKIPRIIPTLLIKERQLVKTTAFRAPAYVGDPMNAVRIFTQKEVDELVILDISNANEIDFEFIELITSNAFMPISYGGMVRSVTDAVRLFNAGVEKIIFNSAYWTAPDVIREVSERCGVSSVCLSIDVEKNLFGAYRVRSPHKWERLEGLLDRVAKDIERLGVGEVLLQSMSLDGTMRGVDRILISTFAKSVTVPLVYAGGVGKFDDLRLAHDAGASAIAAGSFFIYHGKHRAVLISYPQASDLKRIFDV